MDTPYADRDQHLCKYCGRTCDCGAEHDMVTNKDAHQLCLGCDDCADERMALYLAERDAVL